MNQRIKKMWLAALRSGEYQQTTGQLKDDLGFCCLGVLCDLHAKETGNEWKGYYYYKNEDFLPFEVKKWASVDSCNPRTRELGGRQLTSLNDDHDYSFAQIADVIERDL